jgi:hypothetical protein
LKDIFSLVRTVSTNSKKNKMSEPFSDLFIGVVSTDLLKLYQAMGTITDPEGK